MNDIKIFKIKKSFYFNDIQYNIDVYRHFYKKYNNTYKELFISLTEIANILEAEINIKNNVINLVGKNVGEIIFFYTNRKNIRIKHEIFHKKEDLPPTIFTENSLYYTNGKYLISLYTLSHLINGSILENIRKITLYTFNYDRKDLPLTLNDYYTFLDNMLDEKIKEKIKKSSEGKLITDYHRTLGLWIRNKWFFINNIRIHNIFQKNGIWHQDDMSHTILNGYRYYLQGKNKTLKELRD